MSLSTSADFLSLVQGNQFVDKSDALKCFLADYLGGIHILLRPRRSGKTTLLSMFRSYLENVNPEKLAKREECFKELSFYNDPLFKRYFGAFPVLHVNFNAVFGPTMPHFIIQFKRTIAHALQWVPMLPENSLDDYSVDFFKRAKHKQLQDDECVDALRRLTEIMCKAFSHKVIILIDEYDTPLASAVSQDCFDEVNKFLREVYQRVWKDNDRFLCGGLIVGILHLAKTGFLSGLNNIQVYTLDDQLYAHACMFTEEETRQKYDQETRRRAALDMPPLAFAFNDLCTWYNGYSSADGTRLYNPWSIANALLNNELRSYWVRSGHDTSQILAKNQQDTFRSQLAELLSDEVIEICPDTTIAHNSFKNMSSNQLWTFLYYTGYLTTATKSHGKTLILRIPNVEITTFFQHQIIEPTFAATITSDQVTPEAH